MIWNLFRRHLIVLNTINVNRDIPSRWFCYGTGDCVVTCIMNMVWFCIITHSLVLSLLLYSNLYIMINKWVKALTNAVLQGCANAKNEGHEYIASLFLVILNQIHLCNVVKTSCNDFQVFIDYLIVSTNINYKIHLPIRPFIIINIVLACAITDRCIYIFVRISFLICGRIYLGQLNTFCAHELVVSFLEIFWGARWLSNSKLQWTDWAQSKITSL